MRLWRYQIQNWLGDAALILAGWCAMVGVVLFASQILMDITGNH